MQEKSDNFGEMVLVTTAMIKITRHKIRVSFNKKNVMAIKLMIMQDYRDDIGD